MNKINREPKCSKSLIKVAAVLATLTPATAFAHAHLVSSTPAQNAVIQKGPKEIVLHFSEELERSMCKLKVTNLKTGEQVNQGEITNEGKDQSTLKTMLKPLNCVQAKICEFEVSWKAVSKDSHRMPGHYKFTLKPEAK